MSISSTPRWMVGRDKQLATSVALLKACHTEPRRAFFPKFVSVPSSAGMVARWGPARWGWGWLSHRSASEMQPDPSERTASTAKDEKITSFPARRARGPTRQAIPAAASLIRASLASISSGRSELSSPSVACAASQHGGLGVWSLRFCKPCAPCGLLVRGCGHPRTPLAAARVVMRRACSCSFLNLTTRICTV